MGNARGEWMKKIGWLDDDNNLHSPSYFNLSAVQSDLVMQGLDKVRDSVGRRRILESSTKYYRNSWVVSY